MQWLNEPKTWKDEAGTLVVTTDAKTDFWRHTHYGFVRDNAHVYFEEVTGDFLAEVFFVGRYREQYDQAGLMVRLGERDWLKTGIEYVEGKKYASAVVTRDFSDWSVQPLLESGDGAGDSGLWLRLTRQGTAFTVHTSLDKNRFELLRLAYLPAEERVQLGMMCASPEGSGFEVTFSHFRVQKSGAQNG